MGAANDLQGLALALHLMMLLRQPVQLLHLLLQLLDPASQEPAAAELRCWLTFVGLP
jgi:hypothetical protein